MSGVQLGTVRAPSGIIVVIDAGYAGLWCSRERDFEDDGRSPLDEKAREIAANSVDLHIVVANAEEAGRRFGDRVTEIKQLFSDSIAHHGLDATVRACRDWSREAAPALQPRYGAVKPDASAAGRIAGGLWHSTLD
jgi:hypothetical protein